MKNIVAVLACAMSLSAFANEHAAAADGGTKVEKTMVKKSEKGKAKAAEAKAEAKAEAAEAKAAEAKPTEMKHEPEAPAATPVPAGAPVKPAKAH